MRGRHPHSRHTGSASSLHLELLTDPILDAEVEVIAGPSIGNAEWTPPSYTTHQRDDQRTEGRQADVRSNWPTVRRLIWGAVAGWAHPGADDLRDSYKALQYSTVHTK